MYSPPPCGSATAWTWRFGRHSQARQSDRRSWHRPRWLTERLSPDLKTHSRATRNPARQESHCPPPCRTAPVFEPEPVSDAACRSARTCVTLYGTANGNWHVCCGHRQPGRCHATRRHAMGIDRCCWKRWWTQPVSAEPATGRQLDPCWADHRTWPHGL
jgi:hypothetical protein